MKTKRRIVQTPNDTAEILVENVNRHMRAGLRQTMNERAVEWAPLWVKSNDGNTWRIERLYGGEPLLTVRLDELSNDALRLHGRTGSRCSRRWATRISTTPPSRLSAVRVLARRCKRVAVTGGHERFIWDNDHVLNRPAYCTSDMTSAVLLCGDFSKAILGLRGGGIAVEVNPYNPTLFEKGIVQIRVMVSCDVTVPAISAFFRSGTIT